MPINCIDAKVPTDGRNDQHPGASSVCLDSKCVGKTLSIVEETNNQNAKPIDRESPRSSTDIAKVVSIDDLGVTEIPEGKRSHDLNSGTSEARGGSSLDNARRALSADEPTKSIDGVKSKDEPPKRVEPLRGSERFLDSLSRIPEGNPTTNDLRSSTDFGGVFSFHSLESTWSMYYHLPQDKNWTLLSYVPIMEKIDTVEKLIAVNECIPDNVIKYCMLFVMKEGITPMWEDINNRTGGCFSYKVINRVVPAVWRELMYLLGGNVLTINPEHMNFVNGITISPKKNFSIVKIWMLDCSLQDPACIKPILNLVKNGCMFRKHEPEF